MKRILIIVGLFFVLPLSAAAQHSQTNNDEADVRQAVQTYLDKKDAESVRRVLHPEAKIFSMSGNGKLAETAISKPAKEMKGAVSASPQQNIVAVDAAQDGATVKVETVFSSNLPSALQKHFQYLSLLKLNGEWKIISILMPSIKNVEQVNATN